MCGQDKQGVYGFETHGTLKEEFVLKSAFC